MGFSKSLYYTYSLGGSASVVQNTGFKAPSLTVSHGFLERGERQ